MSETFTTPADLLPRPELAKIAGETVAARRTQALETWQKQSMVLTPDSIAALEAEIAVVAGVAADADALAGEAKTLALEAQITANTAEALAEEALAAAGRATLPVTAAATLTAGDFVHVFNASGAQAELADATGLTKPANGYVIDNIASGDTGTVYLGGSNGSLSGLSAGATYWLSTTPGAITTTAPSASGNLDQIVGVAVDDKTLLFTFTPGVGV